MRHRLLLLAALTVLSGCAAPRATTASAEYPARSNPPAVAQAEVADPGGVTVPGVNDPWGRFNRGVYRFNARFDEAVHWPVANAYQRSVPAPVRGGVGNFFSNLGEIRNTGNHLLQGRPRYGLRTTSRFVINSTLGLAGLFDVAEHMGIGRRPTHFGNTLGRWGVGPGPYLVLPVLGPSSLRDTIGLAADFGLNRRVDVAGVYSGDAALPVGALYAVDSRARLSFRYYQSGSPFEYEMLRFLYMVKREIEVEGARALPQSPGGNGLPQTNLAVPPQQLH